METLSKRLQVWSFYIYKPQQPPTVYKYKKPELQSSSLDLKTVKILFLKLSIIKAKLIELPIFYHHIFNRVLKKNHLASQKYQSIILPIVVANKNVKTDNINLFSLTLGHYLLNSLLSIAISVLKYYQR